jgi:hypothetical protein
VIAIGGSFELSQIVFGKIGLYDSHNVVLKNCGRSTEHGRAAPLICINPSIS